MHITGSQPPTCSNFLPLQFTLLPQKLKEADYETHMASPCPRHPPTLHHNHFHLFTYLAQVGKGHLGYMTMDHLPANRGFDTHLGVRSCCRIPPHPTHTDPFA